MQGEGQTQQQQLQLEQQLEQQEQLQQQRTKQYLKNCFQVISARGARELKWYKSTSADVVGGQAGREACCSLL